MKRRRRMRTALALTLWAALCLLLCIFCGTAGAMADGDVFMNERLVVPGDGKEHVYTFVPTANNLYTIRSFGGAVAQAALYLEDEDEPVAQADGLSMDVRLIADATYHLKVVCPEDGVEVEIMRCALGRCFDQPLDLKKPDAGYDKVIARAYDTHWFRFTAPVSGLYVIRTQSQINTVGYLLDESGRKLALSDNLYSPYCLDFRITYRMEAGCTYIVRVNGRGGETGQYHLVIAVPGEGQPVPERAQMSEQALDMVEGGTASLSCRVLPKGAIDDIVWMSADPQVAAVDADGTVTAVAAGKTRIIASSLDGVDAVCHVTVAPIPVTGLTVEESAFTLHQGEAMTVAYRTVPRNASDQRVIVTSADEQVIAVQPGGLLAAVGEGETTVTLSTRDGGFSRTVSVTVLPARSRYRALLLGLERFEGGDFRLGAVNTTQGIYDLLTRQNYGGAGPEVVMKLDMTREEAIAAIRDTFEQAEENDVSILYINSHGGLSGQMPWIMFADGKLMTAARLEKELRRIKGRIVLLLDCCQSGAFIPKNAGAEFGRRFVGTFSSGAYGRLASGKYCILASAGAAQDSYRLLPAKDAAENNSSTAFARSLCEAGGWDLIGDNATRYRADVNQDHAVTLYEAYLYCSRRVHEYLKGQKAAQDVQLWPKGSQLVLFAHE